uniref:Cytochrome P450 monooxygenase ffsD n=1 Tax=Aspergillus flavipes TaxID=41900 RepID=FFSD_ASPFV|nr:RecName: Full=Cytochrome P450 monooxygenase ffsD; AltName: Full=Cytochalasans biosynthesis cluster protein ffsD [Aspergillus flavipes]QOG08943.1 FfsD [Aspergillus flavipes]
MLQDIVEQWQIMQQALAPLRLTRWQLTKMFAAQVYRDHPVGALLGISLSVVLLLWVISVVTRPKKLEDVLGLPVLGGSRTLKSDFLRIIEEGKQRYPDTPYIVNASGLQYVVYPPIFFDEIKRLTEQEASAQDFFHTVTYGQWTHIGAETDALWKTIAVDLARSVPVKVPSKQKDARIAFDKYVGYCPESKPVTIFDTMMKIVATTNACSFVGREVGTGEWPQVVQQLPMSVYFAVMTLSIVPRIFRPVLLPIVLIPALLVQRKMRKILAPGIRQDMEEYERAADRKELLKPTEDGKLPFTQWLMARYKPGEATAHQLATDHLLTSFESTVSTAATLYNMILDLAVRPELQDELRQEVEEIMVDGKLPATHLKELKKMDSMMRETFRVNPFALFSLYRITRKPIQLSSGPKLPAGTILCVDSHHINNSAELFPEPAKFDPYRFLKKREEPGAENRFQFVSTGPTDPNWGDGTQACPGRFFANSTLKVCLAHVLLKYNVSLREGQERPKMVSMPNGIWAPDMAAQVLFQSRD